MKIFILSVIAFSMVATVLADINHLEAFPRRKILITKLRLEKKIQSPHHVVHSLAITSSPTMTTAQSKNNNNIIRGANKYGISNNSTILGPADAALKVGVKPTKEATKKEWQMAWKLHRYMMKPLHMWDGCRPKDSKLAL